MLKTGTRFRRRFAQIARGVGAAALIVAQADSAWSWPTAHGQPDNTHFANVTTQPAVNASVGNPLGVVAPGAGPVVAPDGTVYVGNTGGLLMAMNPNGERLWARQISQGQSIVASPAIGSDGTIYVISVSSPPADGSNSPRARFESFLHRFTPGGGWLGGIPLPEHNGPGAAGGAPNIWRHNGVEAVMVSAFYKHPVIGGGIDLRLIAFAPGGGVLDDKVVTTNAPTTTGGGPLPPLAMLSCIYIIPCVLAGDPISTGTDAAYTPFPSAAVFTNPNGGTPWILVTDFFKTAVGLTFSGGKLTENFRFYDEDRLLRSSPMTLPNGHTLISFQDIQRNFQNTESSKQDGGIVFTGPNMTKVPPIDFGAAVYATPTRLADGRVVVPVGRSLFVLQGTSVTKVSLPFGGWIAAAASRNHVFVSTADALVTLDAGSLQEVGRQSWTDGGYSPPAIGPNGRVYAISAGRLHVFPGNMLPTSGTAAPGMPGSGIGILGGGVYQDAGIPANPTAPTVQRQSYKPPLTANNNRLFACEELDGDDCGKGDHRAISLAFCQKQGFTKAADFDVDSRKGTAETLGGQFCSKNKCKVFEEIVCKN